MSNSIDKTLKDATFKVVEKSGFSLVDFNIQRLSGNKLKAGVVIYNSEGVSMDNCSDLHKILFPRLEMLADEFDFYLEISSPGISRIFKNREEYYIFVGKKVKILTYDNDDYIAGVIDKCEDDTVFLKEKDGVTEIKIDDIQKGKLDY